MMAPKKRPWFRFYVETFTDVELRAVPPAHRWVWAALLGLARSSPVAGVLLNKAGEPITEAVLADFAAVKPAEVRSALRRFIALEMVRRDESGALVVVKWDTRQFESDDVTTRTARHRAAKNADGTADGTFHSAGDGTDSPSVVLAEVTEEQRTEPSSSSSDARDDDRIGEVAAALAASDLERLRADKPDHHVGDVDRWLASATRKRANLDGSRIAELAASHPDWTAGQITEAMTGAVVKPSPLDDTLRAQRERMDRNHLRLAGSVGCEACEDIGVVELDDGTFTDCACKARRAS